MANDCWTGDVGLKKFGLATVLEESGRSNSRPLRRRCIDFVVLRHAGTFRKGGWEWAEGEVRPRCSSSIPCWARKQFEICSIVDSRLIGDLGKYLSKLLYILPADQGCWLCEGAYVGNTQSWSAPEEPLLQNLKTLLDLLHSSSIPWLVASSWTNLRSHRCSRPSEASPLILLLKDPCTQAQLISKYLTSGTFQILSVWPWESQQVIGSDGEPCFLTCWDWNRTWSTKSSSSSMYRSMSSSSSLKRFWLLASCWSATDNSTVWLCH